MAVGLETVRPGRRYCFDGMRPLALTRPPIGVFLYSLKGWGVLETPAAGGSGRSGGVAEMVPEEHALLVRVPSEHCYRSAPECPEWTFVWFVFDHAYLIERLFSRGAEDFLNRVFALPEESAPVKAALALVEHIWRGGGDDSFSVEEGLFRWMLEMERWVFLQKHPLEPRRKLLEQVRAFTLRHLAESLPVERLAAEFSMSRTHFTQRFSRVTGQMPAGFVREVRLGEAAGLLRDASLSVKEIAARTGFADANHLCKCFRARFHFSPGAYRNLRDAAAGTGERGRGGGEGRR
jgi:AraC-like DNA-binding protein